MLIIWQRAEFRITTHGAASPWTELGFELARGIDQTAEGARAGVTNDEH